METCDLEGQNKPTLRLVILWVSKLKCDCTVVDEDSDEMKTIKAEALVYLEEKCTAHILHKVAVLFNPRQK